jgi:Protein of unknown function (DUF3551)
MRKSVIAGLALWAGLAAFAGKTHAEVNYPWCIIGDTRAVDCYFSSREQCMQDGRNRGFGSQCIKNPFYKPGPPTVSGPVHKRTETARPSQGVSAAATCTGLKSACSSDCLVGAVAPSYVRGTYLQQACEVLLRNPAAAAGGLWCTPHGVRRLLDPYCERECNFYWEHCMKTGWFATSRAAERR